MPKGISIEQICSHNKVPYNIFYKWYKDTRNKIVEVKVEGLPASAQEEQKQEIPSQEPSSTVTFRHLYSFCTTIPKRKFFKINSLAVFFCNVTRL